MEDKEFSYINAVPLIDVMFVLLTIILTTATFVTHGASPFSPLNTGERAYDDRYLYDEQQKALYR